MKNKTNIIILLILITGILYRIVLTSGGNFIFNMDNGRDMVDVREMVVLGKLRLTGPTSAIEGFYNGPAWYYLLAIPFILSGGDPYAAILMEIILWAIGGFFLLKLVSRWGNWLILPVGVLWVASPYIVLTNVYAFNPNPVTLLAPVFIYLLVSYLEKKQAVYGILAWFLGGLFFNFEMNFGVFIPPTIILSLLFSGNFRLLKQKWFWIGIANFLLTLIPQAIFDFRHQFIMSKSVLRHIAENPGTVVDISSRIQTIASSFGNTFSATLFNSKILSWVILGFSIPTIYIFLKDKKKDILALTGLTLIFVPFISYLFLPVTVNPWHWGGEMAVSLILIAYILKIFMKGSWPSKICAVILSGFIVYFGFTAVASFVINDFNKQSMDPSQYKNEIAAIDYVYQYAKGQNFKVYVFMPSVYDYPYQYLFWWYGQKKYGYIPTEYSYAPNVPLYINNKDKFAGSKDKYKGLVFLIKEPNRGYNWKSGWEASYRFLELLSSQKLGLIEVEVRREVRKQ